VALKGRRAPTGIYEPLVDEPATEPLP